MGIDEQKNETLIPSVAEIAIRLGYINDYILRANNGDTTINQEMFKEQSLMEVKEFNLDDFERGETIFVTGVEIQIAKDLVEVLEKKPGMDIKIALMNLRTLYENFIKSNNNLQSETQIVLDEKTIEAMSVLDDIVQ